MYGTTEFVDYYAFLDVPPSSSREVIGDRIRSMYKRWHPDVCKDSRAHEMTVTIGAAKEFLLDDAKRREYDKFREAFNRGSTGSTGFDDWQYEREWTEREQHVRGQAERTADLHLEDLLAGLVGIAAVGAVMAVGAAAVGAEYAWQGTERFHGDASGSSFGQRFWCGIGGWACVICLIVPGTSIITFYCFYWAFFPGPSKKFIGFGTVLGGMVVSALIVVPLLACLIGVVMNGSR